MREGEGVERWESGAWEGGGELAGSSANCWGEWSGRGGERIGGGGGGASSARWESRYVLTQRLVGWLDKPKCAQKCVPHPSSGRVDFSFRNCFYITRSENETRRNAPTRGREVT